MNFYSIDKDLVIGGYVITASSDYKFALDQFAPLIGRLDIQRDALNTKFYSRLQDDIVRGCVMPPLTIALIHSFEGEDQSKEAIFTFIAENIKEAFVLDGIQRLTTLKRASTHVDFNSTRPIHVNFVIAGSRDKLLYRMITLNNGQKPMSARHQIDVLADAFFDFDGVDLKLVAEKGKGRVRTPDTFKKADFVKGYVAYLSGSVNIDNQKIIEEKMDELIASKIIESNIPSQAIEFSDVVELINKLSASPYLHEWIRGQNNFIGFCVGARRSAEDLNQAPLEQIETAVKTFESAIKSIDVTKVNLGKVRRETVSKFIENYKDYQALDEYQLLDQIAEWI